MHVKVMHYGRKWARAANHMDARHCPECGATVHGNRGQHEHQRWHGELAEVLASLSERAAVDDEPVPWVAAVDELEAAE